MRCSNRLLFLSSLRLLEAQLFEPELRCPYIHPKLLCDETTLFELLMMVNSFDWWLFLRLRQILRLMMSCLTPTRMWVCLLRSRLMLLVILPSKAFDSP